MISAPGCLSAALIDENLEGHNDNLTHKSINYYHGSCVHKEGNLIITSDLFDNQVSELAQACDHKIQNDIIQFKQDNQLDEVQEPQSSAQQPS
jgi:hypothetical protein